ncbi:MAG: type I-C CRISPR-associated protein Cas8c/Csd1 [Lawsonibacter sp.]|nr:type I-C CRISPR-associated protein Cas8c/Csd1 [Lawsonibacter sp.]
MILQALVEHYEDLAAQGTLAHPGWSDAKISYALYINDAGELEQVADIRKIPEDGKGKPKPQKKRLPSPPTGRTSLAIKPTFLWDNSKYLLGIDNKGKAEQSIKSFQGSRDFHHKLLDDVDSLAAQAVLAFFDRWDPGTAREHPALADKLEDILAGANMVFRYNGAFLQDDPRIQEVWQDHYDFAGDGLELLCLVTGQKGPAEPVHPSVKGVAGAQSSGAALVSFNGDAFCSYGRKQSYNAPTSKYAAFAYTSALNHLLAERDYVGRIGDTTVLFWASGGQRAYQSFSVASLFGAPTAYSASDLQKMMLDLCQGKSVLFEETQLDPSTTFYVLGLSPNAARLSVRFFLKNSFGAFIQNIQAHQERLEIVRPSFDKFETLPLWKLLDATVNQKSRDKSPSPGMAGETFRAILNNTPYPASLLNGTVLRIRAEQRDKDHPDKPFKMTRERAAILKAYYLKRPHSDMPKEVLTVSLNPDSTNIPYVLGRLFSVLEAIQSSANPGINTTIKDKYFNSASATPSRVFPTLINLAQKHLRKLDKGWSISYSKQLTELTAKLEEEFPDRLSLPQQGAFQLGYYHQTQARYQKKSLE